jgi:hypothetical protein
MLQGYTYTQALRMYRKYGVRVAVPVSAHALRIAANKRAASSYQGVTEMGTNVYTVPRTMYRTVQAHTAVVLQLAAQVRASA